ncbi:unnamed protein product [Rangifer tarandus platyrhynchus]|uniref:Uncharacterized protein n=2 Tax=Rangifer tarandus platyrhynchus TaxID=3082113 RepID=A0ABN8XXJ5_RANTA|nr:unnamed protein product [Rangifer tarandus platyrhynchus]
MELEALSRCTSPANPAIFPHVAVVLLAVDMFFTPGCLFMRSPPPSTLGISTESSSSHWRPQSSLAFESSACCSGSASMSELPRVPTKGPHCILPLTVNIFQEPQCLGDAIW